MTVKIVSTSDILAEQAAIVKAAAGETEDKSEAASADAGEEAETVDESETSKTEQEEKELSADGEDEGEEVSAGEKLEQNKKKPGGYQRKIDKLTGIRRDLEASNARLLAELEAARAGGAKSDPKQIEAKGNTEDALKEPDPTTFEKHEDYLKALVKWDRETAEHAKETNVKLETEKGRRQKNVDNFNKGVAELRDQHEDFDEALEVFKSVELPLHMISLIYESEKGGELYYQLAKNPEEMKRIAALNPWAAARAMGKFEAKHLSADEAEAKPIKETKKITAAPAPMKPVGGKGSGSPKKSIYDPSLSQSEFEALVAAEESARKRA